RYRQPLGSTPSFGTLMNEAGLDNVLERYGHRSCSRMKPVLVYVDVICWKKAMRDVSNTIHRHGPGSGM
ncbi:MAG: hypothetical protein ACQEUJ_17280, partial [Pseudomonadota bacterium]